MSITATAPQAAVEPQKVVADVTREGEGLDRGIGFLGLLVVEHGGLSKALGDARNYDPRRLESPAGWPRGICGPWRAAPLPLPDGYCEWVCWRVTSGRGAVDRCGVELLDERGGAAADLVSSGADLVERPALRVG